MCIAPSGLSKAGAERALVEKAPEDCNNRLILTYNSHININI